MASSDHIIRTAYEMAQERYSTVGVDTELALAQLAQIPISLPCWQGDDVSGFENPDDHLGGGLAVTGNYPGKARTPDELRSDFEVALSLIPGNHRFNLHASYAEHRGRRVERSEIDSEHFRGWIDWAKSCGIGLDFNPTYFSHPNARDGFTLSHSDPSIRQFWIEHGIACRRIGASIGMAIGSACVTNVWIPDGYKDLPIDRKGPRERLAGSLDDIFADPIDPHHNLDAVEAKLFGIGSESYVVGSHEFYLGYAIRRNKMLCLDSGHFHPTEVVSDKLSAVLTWVDQALLHVSRGIRWDSDHVAILSDELVTIAQELVRGNYLTRVRIGLDFFDASINRVAAWVIGARATIKALLFALVEPTAKLHQLEVSGDLTGRLAMLEELKTMPFGAVWDYYCLSQEVPAGPAWLEAIRKHDREVLQLR